MINRYEITLDKQSFLQWHSEVTTDDPETAIIFNCDAPDSGRIFNDAQEDIVVSSIFVDDIEKTVECLTQYSTWVSTRE